MVIEKSEMQTEVRERMRNGEGSVILSHICNELPKNCRIMSVMTLKPGCSIGDHQHEKETELYYMLTGELTGIEGDREIALKPGDAMVTGNGNCHAIKNNSDQEASFLAVIITE